MIKKYILLIVIITIISCKDESKQVKLNNPNKSSDIKQEYYANGNVKLRAELKEGIEHGAYFKYFKNQTVEESGVKIKGKKNGLWKYYDSLGKIKSAKHFYNDSLVYNLDTSDFEYRSKIIDAVLQVEIPEKWTVIKDAQTPVLLALKKECEKDIPFCPNLTITYESSINTSEIETYLKKNDDVLKSSLNNYKVLKKREYVFEDNTYFEKVYIGSSQGINIGGITTWIFSNKRTYIITGLALNEKENSFLKYEGLFKDIINEIKLKRK
ncbi:toxin-antitoxin system YwqK family antitoxin [Flagellimonas pacifica]|uniref:Uncharacterized protein n=1 Tax=Flagellimonas pacifica TaxID=1247520 RepID=A0A285MW38_9FLAO|nr:hypothetical protein [Allomuricauda parva]SNY99681.1 hypothetical protein SAMN06265377_1492 [Allomuricauda parva]